MPWIDKETAYMAKWLLISLGEFLSAIAFLAWMIALTGVCIVTNQPPTAMAVAVLWILVLTMRVCTLQKKVYDLDY